MSRAGAGFFSRRKIARASALTRTLTRLASLKWKPPSENTIDFKLRLRFPPDLTKDPSGRIPNFAAKPFFQLDQWTGRGGYGGRNAGNGRGGGRGPGSVGEDGYEYFDWMDVSDDEWEEMKASGKQYDDVIIEAAWVAGGDVHRDSRTGEEIVRPARWVMKRIRDDKENANHASILKAIIHSIQDGVEADEVGSGSAYRVDRNSAHATFLPPAADGDVRRDPQVVEVAAAHGVQRGADIGDGAADAAGWQLRSSHRATPRRPRPTDAGRRLATRSDPEMTLYTQGKGRQRGAIHAFFVLQTDRRGHAGMLLSRGT